MVFSRGKGGKEGGKGGGKEGGGIEGEERKVPKVFSCKAKNFTTLSKFVRAVKATCNQSARFECSEWKASVQTPRTRLFLSRANSFSKIKNITYIVYLNIIYILP